MWHLPDNTHFSAHADFSPCHHGLQSVRELLEQVIASLETYDPFEGMLEFPEWKEEDEGEGGSE